MEKQQAMEMTKLAYEVIEDKKGQEITVIDISQISDLADYFIIASGSNSNQVQAMSDEVEKKLAANGCPCRQIEGYRNANWILLDFGDLVIHLFSEEDRQFYDLERIWRDGRFIAKQDLN